MTQSPVTPTDATPPTSTWWVLATLSMLMGFALISTDLYLPATPAMQGALHASAGTIELTISGYRIGFSLGQLLWGPIGDRFSRRLLAAIGLILFIVGSAGCAMSDTAAAMIGCRVVQAASACASVVLARAMVRDLYAGAPAVQMMSTLMTLMAVAGWPKLGLAPPNQCVLKPPLHRRFCCGGFRVAQFGFFGCLYLRRQHGRVNHRDAQAGCNFRVGT